MMRNTDTSELHIQNLLEQRSQSSRVRSPSELSNDSPSIYSNAYFSPRPETTRPRQNSRSSQPRSPSGFSEHPAASILDLDDDPRASYASSPYPEDDRDDEDTDYGEQEDDEPVARMSMLGPKMRKHSRAPWETGDDTLEEEDEDDSPGTSGSSTKSARKGSMGDGIKKGLGFGGTPRSSNSSSRPSGESTRSQTRGKSSFDNSGLQNNRSVFHALTQASISSTSLSLPTSGTPNPASSTPGLSIRNKFSMGRPRPSATPVPSSGRPPSPGNGGYASYSPRDALQLNSHQSESGRGVRPSAQPEEDTHPYAHPDLAFSYSPPPQSPLRSTSFGASVSRSDSVATITESGSSTRSAMTSAMSSSSMGIHPARTPSVQGKEISSPRSIQTGSLRTTEMSTRSRTNSSTLPPHSGIPGWSERPESPTFALISLEEARAQRSRSATAQPAISNPIAGSSRTPYLDADCDSIADESSSPASRARARSISAGVKAKNALQTMVAAPAMPRFERRESESGAAPQLLPTVNGSRAPALKHKKSGFMRLFNGKEKEKERERPKTPPPPVPTISDAFAHTPTISRVIKTSRVPVPRISPGEVSPSTSTGSVSPVRFNPPFGQDLLDPGTADSRRPSPTKRIPPPLSIKTTAETTRAPSSASAEPPSSWQTRTTPTNTTVYSSRRSPGAPPQSAPAHVTDFPSLSLRPVSTVFSAQFGDHIVRQRESDRCSEPDLDDTLSPLSSGTAVSPITPGFCLNEPIHVGSQAYTKHSHDDQSSAIIRALQEQIVSAKKTWQHHIWELEGQVRDLKSEVDGLRSAAGAGTFCEMCGKGPATEPQPVRKAGVVDRPRARTGNLDNINARFGTGWN